MFTVYFLRLAFQPWWPVPYSSLESNNISGLIYCGVKKLTTMSYYPNSLLFYARIKYDLISRPSSADKSFSTGIFSKQLPFRSPTCLRRNCFVHCLIMADSLTAVTNLISPKRQFRQNTAWVSHGREAWKTQSHHHTRKVSNMRVRHVSSQVRQ